MAREAVIVDSVRTGLTKAHRGSFNMTEPVDYTAHVLREVVARQPALDAEEVEDVILGCGMPEGCQGMNMGRVAAMAAGFPKTVAATTVNRFCSSGSQAIMPWPPIQILNEGAEVAIGAGVETITMMQDGTQNTNRMVNETAKNRFPGLYFPMGVTAEVVAERYKHLQRRPGRLRGAEPGAVRRFGRSRQGRRGHRSDDRDPARPEEGRGALRRRVQGRAGRVQPAGYHRRGAGQA